MVQEGAMDRDGIRGGRRQGVVLVLVSLIVVMLMMMGALFAQLQVVGRFLSRSAVDQVRGGLLARSGAERMLKEQEWGTDPAYLGEDYNADGLLTPGAPETTGQVYQPTGLNTSDCPLEHALRPSFFSRRDQETAGGVPAPDQTLVDGRVRGFSGRLRGTHVEGRGARGDTYVIQASSPEGIYLNGGALDTLDDNVDTIPNHKDPTTGYNATLFRLLGNLGLAIDTDSAPVPDNLPVGQADGELLLTLRPPGGWSSWTQIRDDAFGGNMTKVNALRPYLTLRAWSDKRVVRPNVKAVGYQVWPKCWAEILLDHNNGMPGLKAPDFERVSYLSPGSPVIGRAPVSLAWARTRRPVLVALLTGLKAYLLDDYYSTGLNVNFSPPTGDYIGKTVTGEISSAEAVNIAGLLMVYGGNLRTWEDWNAFCDTIPSNATTGITPNVRPALDQGERDILKANFNPNSDLNKFNPNVSTWRMVDKSDLLAYSTEFHLYPISLNGYEGACLGRVTDLSGSVRGSRQVRVSCAGVSVARLTTQREFACENLGSLDRAGDETDVRLPGFQRAGAAPFILSSEGDSRTWGHRLDLRDLYPGTWMNGDANAMGIALQTYPEPLFDIDGPPPVGVSPLAMNPADYDGSVQLATIEARLAYHYDVLGTDPALLMMLASYDDSLDLEPGTAGTGALANQPFDFSTTPPAPQQIVTSAELGNSVAHATKPNSLRPDGVYSERNRIPSYLDADNMNGFHGVISMWFKSNGAFGYGRGSRLLKWTNYTTGVVSAGSPDQFFALAVFHTNAGKRYFSVCGLETNHQPLDGDTSSGAPYPFREHFWRTPLRATDVDADPHEWHLVTFLYDTRSPVRDHIGELIVDDGVDPEKYQSLQGNYLYSSRVDINAQDFTQDDMFGDHRISLGALGIVDRSYWGTGPDTTLDEFVVWDFGGADGLGGATPAATLESPWEVAQPRYKEGRYYKESAYPAAGGLLVARGAARRAGEYFSAPLPLGVGSRIRAISWTQAIPPSLRAPIDPGIDGRIGIEFANLAGTDYAVDGKSIPMDTLWTDAAWSRIDRTVNDPFRLHAVFQPNKNDPLNTPILDPLVLDDITVVYERSGGIPILSWVEE